MISAVGAGREPVGAAVLHLEGSYRRPAVLALQARRNGSRGVNVAHLPALHARYLPSNEIIFLLQQPLKIPCKILPRILRRKKWLFNPQIISFFFFNCLRILKVIFVFECIGR